jgi:hypothetical protein
MVDTLTLQPALGQSLQRTRSSSGASWADDWKSAKGEEHMLSGMSDDNKTQWRHALQFDLPDWSTIESISRARLHVFTAADHEGVKTKPLTDGADNLKVAYKTKAWTEQGGGETVWTGSVVDNGADFSDTYRGYTYVGAQALAEYQVDVLPIVKAWAPDTVKVNGNPGLGKANYGVVLGYAGSDGLKHRTVMASHKHVDTSIRPFLVLEVVLKGGPGEVTLGPPDGDIPAGVPEFFTGDWAPGRPGDKMAKIGLAVLQTGEDTIRWEVNPTSNDVATSSFSVRVPAWLKSQTTYTWTVRVQNQRGEWTQYAAPTNTVRLTSSPPSVSAVEPHGTLVTLDSVQFRANYVATAGEYRASGWQVQMRTQLGSGDPTWGDDLLWDTGWMTVPLSWANQDPTSATWVQYFKTPYGGPGLSPSTTYSYRIRARDAFGGTSNWQYGQFTLSAAYLPPTSDIRTNLTAFARQPPFRIRIYGMGTNRGPGKLVAELTDAANVGASEFYNAAGEFYFTIPAIHPQVSVIEPYQTHYALEEHTGQGWTGKAYGLITDFDADEDEVVFYGQDYLALLGRTVEERFSPVDAELPTDKGGAKYVDKTIKEVIVDQLTKEKAKANSPVGFIQVDPDDIADMAEKVTIYASFKQRLPFIAGLIESSRAGTGRKTRLVVERDINGVFHWKVLWDPGITRDNLKLVYGELVQGFRTVPFSQWGTAIDALGRTVLGTKVYSARSVAPGISEATYGAFPSTTMYSDIDDLNDLRRRAAQAAAKVAKVGKMMGLGLRVGWLTVKDGWDICDSVPVEIKRGVVDTSRFGSGYYTIWGWTWSSFADGHVNTVLSLAPREDTVPPNPDLIPSSPILDQSGWQTGDHPPTTANDGEHWLDTTTGDIYERDVYGDWILVGNIMGPEGPAGEGGSGAPLGDWLWEETRGGPPPAGHIAIDDTTTVFMGLYPDGGAPGDMLLDDDTGEGLYPDALTGTDRVASENIYPLVRIAPDGTAPGLPPTGEVHVRVDANGLVYTIEADGTVLFLGPGAAGINAFIDGGITLPATGVALVWQRVPFNGVIERSTLIADVSGSAVLDIRKRPFGGGAAVSICGTSKPTLSGQQESEDSTLTGWTKPVAEGDILYWYVDTVTTCKKVGNTLKVRRT